MLCGSNGLKLKIRIKIKIEKAKTEAVLFDIESETKVSCLKRHPTKLNEITITINKMFEVCILKMSKEFGNTLFFQFNFSYHIYLSVV